MPVNQRQCDGTREPNCAKIIKHTARRGLARPTRMRGQVLEKPDLAIRGVGTRPTLDL